MPRTARPTRLRWRWVILSMMCLSVGFALLMTTYVSSNNVPNHAPVELAKFALVFECMEKTNFVRVQKHTRTRSVDALVLSTEAADVCIQIEATPAGSNGEISAIACSMALLSDTRPQYQVLYGRRNTNAIPEEPIMFGMRMPVLHTRSSGVYGIHCEQTPLSHTPDIQPMYQLHMRFASSVAKLPSLPVAQKRISLPVAQKVIGYPAHHAPSISNVHVNLHHVHPPSLHASLPHSSLQGGYRNHQPPLPSLQGGDRTNRTAQGDGVCRQVDISKMSELYTAVQEQKGFQNSTNCPQGKMGIGMGVGTQAQVNNAFVSLKILRSKLKSTLPVAIFYWSDELHEAVKSIFLSTFEGVRFVDIKAEEIALGCAKPRRISGFALKACAFMPLLCHCPGICCYAMSVLNFAEANP